VRWLVAAREPTLTSAAALCQPRPEQRRALVGRPGHGISAGV